MGYVEDIKKINKMAKELISHGMASSFDEAVQKATKMLSEGSDVTHSRDFEPVQQQQQQQQQQQPMPKKEVEQPKQQDSGRDERTGMTWQQAMAKNNEYIVKMLKDFQKQMQEHHSKVTQIESGVNELARRQSKMGEMMVSAPKGSEEINIEDEEPEQQQEQPRGFPKKEEETKPAQEKKDPNPRSGNYNPEDVSIENVFYFGNKK